MSLSRSLSHIPEEHDGGFHMLKPGDKAPTFNLKNDAGADVSLSDFRGKRLILFLFPKANTSG